MFPLAMEVNGELCGAHWSQANRKSLLTEVCERRSEFDPSPPHSALLNPNHSRLPLQLQLYLYT